MPDIPETIPPEDKQLIRGLLDDKPAEFTDLTLTQHEAFADGVLDDNNHLLVAETGNGKTFVAEALCRKALNEGEKVAYLVPSVALVGEKHEIITQWADDRATINQGYGYADADIIVATFESYFEAAIRGLADRFDRVVLDDFHEIYSSHRGPNIEKGISAALDNGSSVLAVSATVGNPHTVARWLDADLTISSEERAVPIREQPVEKTEQDYATQIAGVIRRNRDNGPFLVFNETKPYTESRARGVSQKVSFKVESDIDFREEISSRIDTELTESHKTLVRLLRNGIAYHHSNLEPGVKDLIEEYANEGIVKCIFCTTTLSYGFDSPTQSVIVADLKRRHGFIGVYEYVQWIGRAGRYTELYDEAYAFPMYRDEEAADVFQFDTPVEDKDIEDVESHLSNQEALRWVVLELVANGWEKDSEVVEFIQSTLFWSETVDQVPAHIELDVEQQPGQEVVDEIETTLDWLADLGLIHAQVGQPQTDETRYTATEIGEAIVEYEHSNWFDNTINSVLSIANWLKEHDEDMTPEMLIERISEEYYYCDTGNAATEATEIGKRMSANGLFGTPGTTAALTCWLWCDGVPVSVINGQFDNADLSGFANVANNISSALNSVQLLYDPHEMPAEPKWMEKLTTQVSEGIPGPDTYLVDTVDHFGRVLYNNLTEQLNATGRHGDWDVGKDHYVIERLSALLSDRPADQFLDVVRSTDKIGEQIGENILEAVEAWNPDDNARVEVPFVESLTDRDDSLVRHHTSPDDGDQQVVAAESGTQTTSLNDFQ